MKVSICDIKEERWEPKKMEIIFETEQEYRIFDDMLIFHTSIPKMMADDGRVKDSSEEIEAFLLNLRAGFSG